LTDAWINARNNFYVRVTDGLNADSAEGICIPVNLFGEW